MPDLSTTQWALVLLAGFGVGVGLFHVVVFAFLFGAKASTGVVLPMLLFGDVCAVAASRQHARWDYVRRMSLPTGLGVIAGWALMHSLNESAYKPVIGGIILGLATMQSIRMTHPDCFSQVPHATWFVWSLGLLSGFSTMLANAAGPIIALYLVAVSLPKLELVGTTAWFFLLLNVFKIPFSFGLGLINLNTLSLNAALTPMIVLGLFSGRWLIHRIPQRLFDSLVLTFSAVAALRLIGAF